MLPGTPQPVLPEAWTRVLQSIESSLAEVLDQVKQRQDSLSQEDRPEQPWPAACQDVLTQLDQHMDRMEQGVNRAGQCASEADAALGECVQNLDHWLVALRRVEPPPQPATKID